MKAPMSLAQVIFAVCGAAVLTLALVGQRGHHQSDPAAAARFARDCADVGAC
jgi:hypothetical protein